MFSFLRFDFELPLLKRELLELAQRKRTLCAALYLPGDFYAGLHVRLYGEHYGCV